MHWSGPWHMDGMGVWWMLLVLAAVVVIVAVLSFIVRSSQRSAGSEESPEQALKRRYANGEVDRDNYERMLGDLRK